MLPPACNRTPRRPHVIPSSSRRDVLSPVCAKAWNPIVRLTQAGGTHAVRPARTGLSLEVPFALSSWCSFAAGRHSAAGT